MNSIHQLPPERDLPADRRARMRTHLLLAIAQSSARRPNVARGLAVRVATVGLVLAAGAAATWVGTSSLGGSSQQSQVYALGDGVLSPPIRNAGRECLKYASYDKGSSPMVTWPANSPPILLNHIEQPGRGAIIVYQAQSKLIYCNIGPAVKDGPEPRDFTTDGSGAAGIGVLDSTPWLPGPISLEHAWSTDLDGGYLDVAGRVSDRVARVILDDDAGHQSTARLVKGTFVVFSDGRIAPGAGMLISYDTSGKEIDRRQALSQPADRCYTDPAGNLVNPISSQEFELAYKANAAHCRPAVRWQPGRDAPTPK